MSIWSVAMPAALSAASWKSPRESTPAEPCRITTAGSLRPLAEVQPL
jgi:hypothetical protein